MSDAKRILLAAPHWTMSTGRHVDMALRRLGHDVKSVGPCHRNELGNGAWIPDYEPLAWPAPEHPQQHTPADQVLAHFEMQGWTPDLIISVMGTYALSGKTPMPHAIWSVETDEHCGGYVFGGEQAWDYLFINDMCSAMWDRENVHYLASGYDPEIHQNRVPYEDRPVQLVLAGNNYHDRTYYMSLLSREFRSIYTWGLTWKQYAAAYNAGMVSLCLPSTKGITPQRVFETLAMGCLLLSPTMPDFERLGLVAEHHYLPFESFDDAQRQMRRVVFRETELWKTMQPAAAEWVKDQTWDARCEELLKVVFDD